MSIYSLENLVKRWRQEQMTVEQMIGQILLHLIALETQVAELEKRLAK